MVNIMKKLALISIAATLSTISGAVPIFGVKATQSAPYPSTPPTMLFHFPSTGGPLVMDGPLLSTGGTPGDVDGIAGISGLPLRGYWIIVPGLSQLVAIDVTTNVFFPIGPALVAEFRAACFDPMGRLWAVDTLNSRLFEINPITGNPMGVPLPIHVGPNVLPLDFRSDISTTPDGLMLTRGNEFFILNPATGNCVPYAVDNFPGADGALENGVGLAADSPNLFVSDGNLDDDIFRYAFPGPARSLMHANFGAAQVALTGDLACDPRAGVINSRSFFGQWFGQDAGIPIVVEVDKPETGGHEESIVTTTAEGNWTVPTQFIGDVIVSVKGPHWLRRSKPFTLGVTGGTIPVYVLMNGDVDNNNEVGPGDFGIFSHAWNSYPGHPRWNPMADLDGDEEVGPSDFGILSSNWGESGD